MNTLILNRAAQLPADGWLEIETPGDHPNAAAGLVQRLDGPAFDAIVNRFGLAAAQPNFAGLLVDQDHFSLDATKSSEAFGWLKEIRHRAGHLEGRIDWTDLGKAAVESKRYKFFSTVYEPAPVEKIGMAQLANRSVPLVRPLILDRLALTNDPNNKGGKPISNRDGNPAGAVDENQPIIIMKSLLKKLGLAEDASEDSAVAALQTIQNRASQVEALTAERDTLLKDQVAVDLARISNRIKPDQIESVRAQLIANRAATLALFDSLAAEVAPGSAAARQAITNRNGARPPVAAGGGGADQAAALEEVRAAQIQNRARALRSTDKGLSISRSYELAESEHPAPAA